MKRHSVMASHHIAFCYGPSIEKAHMLVDATTQTQIEIHHDIGSSTEGDFPVLPRFLKSLWRNGKNDIDHNFVGCHQKSLLANTWYTKVDLKSRNEREQKSQLHNSTLKSNVRFRLPLLTSKVMKSPLKRSTYKVMFRKTF